MRSPLVSARRDQRAHRRRARAPRACRPAPRASPRTAVANSLTSGTRSTHEARGCRRRSGSGDRGSSRCRASPPGCGSGRRGSRVMQHGRRRTRPSPRGSAAHSWIWISVWLEVGDVDRVALGRDEVRVVEDHGRRLSGSATSLAVRDLRAAACEGAGRGRRSRARASGRAAAGRAGRASPSSRRRRRARRGAPRNASTPFRKRKTSSTPCRRPVREGSGGSIRTPRPRS